MKVKLITYLISFIMALLCVGSFYAFDQKDTIEETRPESKNLIPPLVQKELDLKIKKYQKTILDKCRTKALENAESYIDSLVSEELKLQVNDTLRFPRKPIRPELREPIILNDSTSISPIIK